MSTTARKLRKRTRRQFDYPTTEQAKYEGIEHAGPFIHTQKVGTPILDRAIGQGADRKGNPRPSVRQMKRNMRLFEAAQQVPEVDEQPPAELDPKPYRIGRKRYTVDEANSIWKNPLNEHPVFSPRKNYEDDPSLYHL